MIGLSYSVFGIVLGWIGLRGNMSKVSLKRLNVLLKFKLYLNILVVYCTGLIFSFPQEVDLTALTALVWHKTRQNIPVCLYRVCVD